MNKNNLITRKAALNNQFEFQERRIRECQEEIGTYQNNMVAINGALQEINLWLSNLEKEEKEEMAKNKKSVVGKKKKK